MLNRAISRDRFSAFMRVILVVYQCHKDLVFECCFFNPNP